MSTSEMHGPRRLIEVDLPIRRISEHARREKSIRHGHISTLHIWWARRPLAACRAVLCAGLWPDPVDQLCPESFRAAAATALVAHRREVGGPTEGLDDHEALRYALLDFIAQYANWDLSANKTFNATARRITEAAHHALGRSPNSRPMVLDPFAGGGAIPLEALRVGADVFASDLNPVAITLNRVALELIPRYGDRLREEAMSQAQFIQASAREQLAKFYPRDPDGSTPLAYLWARTIQCEGPGCGARVPLVRSMWLSKKAQNRVALAMEPTRDRKAVSFRILRGREVVATTADKGTVARGSALCPLCNFTTKVGRVREQLRAHDGGADTAQLLAVVLARAGASGRFYREATNEDLATTAAAHEELQQRLKSDPGAVPTERISTNELRRVSVPLYGMTTWGSLFSSRQALSLITLAGLVREVPKRIGQIDPGFAKAVQTILALAVDRQADASSSLGRWHTSGEKHTATFGRQALGMVWDFSEVNVLSEATGGFDGALQWVAKVCDANANVIPRTGVVAQASATHHPLPDDSVDAVITDPPYYDAVPYAHLSDFFYVWMRRMLRDAYPGTFDADEVPKGDEVVVDRKHSASTSRKDVAFYENALRTAFGEARRILRPNGIAVVVFASKTTASWEAVLAALIDAGFVITGSWPIDTEMAAKVAAIGQARLMSSVHLACRPRENADGSLATGTVGDWRSVLGELPGRIHEWLPRLANEGVVGADAIFACLGPALEIFSRYARIEKVSGDEVKLREYLEHVWAAVSREALTMIFDGAETEGLESDARLTAMWLWTLAAAGGGEADELAGEGDDDTSDGGEDDEEGGGSFAAASGGYVLEFDAARKIAMRLGARLEELQQVVEIKADKARLLNVSERLKYLFGQAEPVLTAKKAVKKQQMTLFGELDQAAEAQGWGEVSAPKAGTTTLDRVHQAMLLFGSGRGEALKRFIVEEGVGKQPQFWKLAQSLSALYPSGTDEKRWVDGVLARKKGLGF